MRPTRPLVAVHGFMFDPADVGGANDPAGFFQEMSGIVGRTVTGFSWYSVPFGFRPDRPFHSIYQTARAWLSAWAHGHRNPYAYAWSLAERAACELVDQIRGLHEPVDLVAHSLGVKVALLALDQLPANRVRRVIFFNGAALAVDAWRWAKADRGAQILNLCISGDRVLEWLGSRFNGEQVGACVGSTGLPDPPEGWHDLFLDDATVQRRALSGRGWTLRAEAPGDLLNHGESYRFAGNTDLVRAWLKGSDLADLVADHGE